MLQQSVFNNNFVLKYKIRTLMLYIQLLRLSKTFCGYIKLCLMIKLSYIRFFYRLGWEIILIQFNLTQPNIT